MKEVKANHWLSGKYTVTPYNDEGRIVKTRHRRRGYFRRVVDEVLGPSSPHEDHEQLEDNVDLSATLKWWAEMNGTMPRESTAMNGDRLAMTPEELFADMGHMSALDIIVKREHEVAVDLIVIAMRRAREIAFYDAVGHSEKAAEAIDPVLYRRWKRLAAGERGSGRR